MARPPKYPWRTMAVGENFLALGAKQNDLCNTARIYHRPKRFTTRKVFVNGAFAIRVRRTA